MATTKIILKSKKNPSQLYIRYCNGRNVDLTVPTGLFVNPATYDPDKQDKFNLNLSKLKIFVIEQSNLAFSNGYLLNKVWLQNTVKLFFNRPKNEVKLKNEPHNLYITDYAYWWLENKASEWKVKKGKYMSKKCQSHYKIAVDLLKSFEANNKILIKNVSLSEMERFAEFLESKQYSALSVSKTLGRVRFFINRAKDDKIEVNETFNGKIFLEEEPETEGVYLNEEEIERIYRHDFSYDFKLEAARDSLILSVWSGLRCSDFLYNLSLDNIKDYVIEIKTQKTGAWVKIPLHPQFKAILAKRHGSLPPKLTANEYNKLVKIVCEKAGITQIIHGKLFDPELKRKVIGYYPKYKLISSHSGRRSLASNLYGKVPDALLQAIGGWKTNHIMKSYNKTSKSEYAKVLSEYWNSQDIKV